MKTNIWYTLSPWSSVLEFDKNSFQSAIEITGDQWYEFIQEFSRNDITAYRTIVLPNISPERLKQVEELYQITPTETRKFSDDDIHYIFESVKALPKSRAIRFANTLSEIYINDYQFYTFYAPQCQEIVQTGKKVVDSPLHAYTDEQSYADSVNTDLETYVNSSVKIEDVLNKLHLNLPYDNILNIVPWHGKPFALALKHLGSLDVAYKFFNEHFNAWFTVSIDNISDFMQFGVAIKWPWIIEKDGWYWAENAKWGITSITDFTIRVHYQVQNSQELVYMVTLVSKKWKEVSFIPWKNTMSETIMADFIVKYWPYHLSANKVHLKMIHEMISNTKVPTITTYHQYGLHDYKGTKVLILPDGVFDFDTGRLFPKHDKVDFYFLGGNDGITVDPGSNIDINNIPRFTKWDEQNYDHFHWLTASIYNGKMKHLPLMLACGMAGTAIYPTGLQKPHYYITGTTGSGKSTMSDLLASMFWVKTIIDMYNTTLFPLRVICSSIRRMPLFFQEYRSSMPYIKEKDGIIRLVFDEGSFQRWQKNGNILNYNFEAQMCIEGEDSSSSGSIRSRCIIVTMDKKYKRSDVQWASKLINDAKWQLAWFLTAYTKWTWEWIYKQFLQEWLDRFGKACSNHRLVSNISLLYAGCMAFAPEHKETFESILDELLAEQMKDFDTNGEWAQFMKLISQYYSDERYSKVYIQNGWLYIDEAEIEKYIQRTHRRMDLTVESYAWHMREMWFEVWDYDVYQKEEFDVDDGYKVIFWYRIPLVDCPRRLLVNRKIHGAYTKAKKESSGNWSR